MKIHIKLVVPEKTSPVAALPGSKISAICVDSESLTRPQGEVASCSTFHQPRNLNSLVWMGLQPLKLFPMDFDLLSEYLDGSDAPSPDQLLSNLPHRQTLTHEQPRRVSSASNGAAGDIHDTDIRILHRNHAGAVITKIEDIFESITDCILHEGNELVIPLNSRPKKQTTVNEDHPPKNDRRPRSYTRNLTFPSKSPKEAWKFGTWPSIAKRNWLIRAELLSFASWNFPMKHW